jgi:hypothetical protein
MLLDHSGTSARSANATPWAVSSGDNIEHRIGRIVNPVGDSSSD